MSKTNIYVGNLPYSTKAQELEELFSGYGVVAQVSMMLDRETQQPRGFAFVEMPSLKEANVAVAALAGSVFKGRALTVNCARNAMVRGAGNTSQAAMQRSFGRATNAISEMASSAIQTANRAMTNSTQVYSAA